jgi:hypothetical protein
MIKNWPPPGGFFFARWLSSRIANYARLAEMVWKSALGRSPK